jgi:sugar O-acyltransferase (sialic acid O-acetyltransferase NeuD family)
MTDPLTRLVLIGAGGFARETAEAVRAVNDVQPTFDLLGYLDDDPALHGTKIEGVPVLGPVGALHDVPEALAVACTGNPSNYFSRKRIVGHLDLAPNRYATIVHPSAVVPPSARLGPGTVLLAGVVLTAAVHVGAHVAVMPHVVLTHDDVVGDFVTLASGVRLGGRVQIGEGAYMGAGALVREDRRVGRWSLIGMGSVVTKDVPESEVWMGVPARFVRRADAPSDFAALTSTTGGEGTR